MVELLGVIYTGRGYTPSVLYHKVRLFDAAQEVSRNAAAVSETICRHTPCI